MGTQEAVKTELDGKNAKIIKNPFTWYRNKNKQKKEKSQKNPKKYITWSRGCGSTGSCEDRTLQARGTEKNKQKSTKSQEKCKIKIYSWEQTYKQKSTKSQENAKN